MTAKAALAKDISRTKEYRTWTGMLKRCYDVNYKGYYLYGGRGIKVCDRWRYSFYEFLEDVGHCPADKDSLDRFPNNNGNYEPGNVRWATDKEQSCNRRNTILFEIDGETKSLKDWAKLYNKSYGTVWQRVKKNNMPILTALTQKEDEIQQQNSLKKKKNDTSSSNMSILA